MNANATECLDVDQCQNGDNECATGADADDIGRVHKFCPKALIIKPLIFEIKRCAQIKIIIPNSIMWRDNVANLMF